MKKLTLYMGLSFMITSLMYFPSLAETGNKPVLKYPDFIKHIENMLPEIKANETDLMLYENKVKRSKASGDITAAAGGDYSIQEQTKTTYGTGNASTGSFYAGLNKKLIPTGTTVSTEYNYSKSRYSSLSTGLDYSTYEPSVSLKITQPLLYNFLGRVDKYAEKNAKMQLDIERIKYSENNKSIINAYRKLYFEWILYKEILINIKESISNSKTLEEKIKRQVKAGLSDDDDYQKVVASTLAYECRYEEYLTTLKKIENEVQLYLAQLPDPDKESFNLLFMESNTDAFENVDFSKTNSAKTIELAMENLNYTREVNENKLLPELNVYSQVTRKGYSEDSSSASRMDNTDYSVGFEFTYKIGNNSAESDLKEAEINLLAMKYEYESTLNDYKKSFSGYKSSAEGTKTLLKKTGAVLKALEAQLKTETKKYNQARLNLSYVIETENSIALKKIELLELKYQLIGHYIDYKDLIK